MTNLKKIGAKVSEIAGLVALGIASMGQTRIINNYEGVPFTFFPACGGLQPGYVSIVLNTDGGRMVVSSQPLEKKSCSELSAVVESATKDKKPMKVQAVKGSDGKWYFEDIEYGDYSLKPKNP